MKLFLISIFFINITFAQNEHVLMPYNILNYPGSDTTIRNPYFRTTISSVNPDILVIQEVLSQAGIDGFLNNVMNSFGENYSAGVFFDGPDTDNGIFYKTSLFNFISNSMLREQIQKENI